MTPRFLINPSFRLTSQYLSVRWHQVDAVTLDAEGAVKMPGRTALTVNGITEIVTQFHESTIDIIYHPLTDFSRTKTQSWLRLLMRDVIFQRAHQVLPARVKYWENEKKIFGKGVKIINMRKNILGCCTGDNEIHLPPYLVIFKQEWMDGVILHEMAHYLHKHHRKPFWDFLSQLLGTDSRKAKVKDEIALSPYYEYYCFLTK